MDEREERGMKRIIKRKGKYMLLYPANAWDMNYHLVDTEEDKDYLIDICDVYDVEDITDVENFSGLRWEEFKELVDVDDIKTYAWRINDRY